MNSAKYIIGFVMVILAGIALYSWSKAPSEKAIQKQDAMMKGEEGAMMENKDVTITLGALHGSREQGTAVLSEVNGKTRVVVSASGAPAGASQPMHIHVGSCPTPGAVKYPLNNLVNGTSETMVDVSLEKLLSEGPLAINAHASVTELKTYVMCGDLPSGTGMMKNDDSAMMEKGDTMMKVGSYEAYAPEKLAQAATGDVVLFFRANWCPTCRSLDADIKTNMKNIPEDLTILDVDYDTSTELKKKYGITYQHTLVQVDQNGTMIKKWMGSPTLAAFVAEVK